MNRARFYFLAIVLHLFVLLWANPVAAHLSPPKKEEKKYLEVTLSTEPGPVKPGPDSGPSDKAKSAANPGPLVAGPPPPVAVIQPEPSPPPPVPEPPRPEPVPPPPSPPTSESPPPEPPPLQPVVDNPPVPMPPAQPAPAVAAPPASEVTAAPPSTSPTAKISGAPVSGTGQGNAAQWSLGSGGNGHFYRAFCVPQGITWANANKYANEHGGYLATIHSRAENAFVFSLIDDPKYWTDDSDPFYDGPWLGGYKVADPRASYGGWRWVHDEGPIKFTNWVPPNPDNGQGYTREDSLNFWSPRHHVRGSGWNDRNGNRSVHGFIVEYDTEAAYLAGHPEIDPFARKPAPPPPRPPSPRRV